MYRRRRGVSSRKMRVKELNSFIKLLGPTGLKVLKMFHAGNYASQIARSLGCTRGNITYWKNKLLRLDIIKLQSHDAFKIYSLTPLGLKVLTRSDKDFRVGISGQIIVLEDHAMKFLIVEHEKKRIDWRKLGKPRNWEKLGVKIGGVRVVKTTRHVIIHPGQLRGWDTHDLLVDAGRIVEMVKHVLESKFCMVLSDVTWPVHKPIFRFYHPVAKELVKSGTTIVKGVGSIDESPPERVPHIEFEGEKNARDYLLMPSSVRRLENKVDNIEKSMQQLVDVINQLLSQMVQPAASKNMGKPGVDYVS